MTSTMPLTPNNDSFSPSRTTPQIGKKEGYVYILDSRAVLFGSDANNLTDRIIKILNDQYAAKGKK